MPGPNDVLSEMAIAEWRGQQFPISEWSANQGHVAAEHALQYRQTKIVEVTSGENLEITYRIPFRQGIAKGPYENLFGETWPQFWEDFNDKSEGELRDPILGELTMVPKSISVEASPNKRDGVDVRCTFVEQGTIEDGESVGIPTTIGAYSEAQALDAEVEKIDWEQEEPPGPTTDPLSAIAGVGAQLDQARGRVEAKLHDTAMRCEKVEAACEKLESPERTAGTVRAARRLNVSARRMNDRAQNPGRTVRTVTTEQVKSTTALAAEFGITLEELLDLNPALAALPFVPAGTDVNRYE